MNFELPDEARMIVALAEKFVNDELMPLEHSVLKREAEGGGFRLTAEEAARLDNKARQVGLWAMDAPAEFGGMGLSEVAMTGVRIALGRTVTPYVFQPDAPNLRMLAAAANEEQRSRYFDPCMEGRLTSAIAISEPGAGADPSGMATRAEKTGKGWRLNGSKLWISGAEDADFFIVMAVSKRAGSGRAGITAFLVGRENAGMKITRCVPMIGGLQTYEVAFEDCDVSDAALLGVEGNGFTIMQLRLGVRRLELASWCVGMAERAMSMMISHAKLRKTFGQPLSDRQTVQWWIADGLARIKAVTLMLHETAWKIDNGRDTRVDVSMLKYVATEMAQWVIDNAMQAFGAMGMAKETPLHLMANQVRVMRIYDGPSEVHRWVVARDAIRTAQ